MLEILLEEELDEDDLWEEEELVKPDAEVLLDELREIVWLWLEKIFSDNLLEDKFLIFNRLYLLKDKIFCFKEELLVERIDDKLNDSLLELFLKEFDSLFKWVFLIESLFSFELFVLFESFIFKHFVRSEFNLYPSLHNMQVVNWGHFLQFKIEVHPSSSVNINPNLK